jgi:hypothetical protein
MAENRLPNKFYSGYYQEGGKREDHESDGGKDIKSNGRDRTGRRAVVG